jgi:hypothetical protein
MSASSRPNEPLSLNMSATDQLDESPFCAAKGPPNVWPNTHGRKIR